jgi:hypothetical protein
MVSWKLRAGDQESAALSEITGIALRLFPVPVVLLKIYDENRSSNHFHNV